MPRLPYLERLLDWAALRPTTHELPAHGLTSSHVHLENGTVELFLRQSGRNGRELHVLKFVGSAGRAENVTDHPFDCWTEHAGRVWVANPPGYGNSPGRASLRSHWSTAVAVHRDWQRRHPDQLPVLTGTSLGGTTAICLAATVPCAGLIVRDMPPIRGVIEWRYRTFPRIAAAFARRVPPQLDVIEAAKKCHQPAVFVSSQRDRVVPPKCQNEVIDAYGGEKRVVVAESDHGGSLSPVELEAYRTALRWLRDRIAPLE